MSEQEKIDKTFLPNIKSIEITEGDGKDKDKMYSNDLKSLFNITANKIGEYIKESKNIKKGKLLNKIHKKSYLRNINGFYTSSKNKRYENNTNSQLNTSGKDLSLNRDNSVSCEDILTIVNASKKNITNSFSQKPEIIKPKKKEKKVDMFYALKFQNVKPKKDYSFKNSTSTIFSKDEKDKFKSKYVAIKLKSNKNKQIQSFSKFDKNEKHTKRQVLDPKLQKILSKPNNSIVTTYLDRKKINDLPILYPLFLSYNNSYNTQSEKSRVNKILEKFVKLKTQILNDYKNREKIMKEFIVRNGVNDKKYLTSQNFSNLYEYLKKPFQFDPKKMISDIIKEALNYKSNLLETDRNKLLPVNYFNNHNITHRNVFFRHLKSNSLDNLDTKEIKLYQNPICLNFKGLKFDNVHLPKLVMELEENIEKIQNEGAERINKLRGGIKKLKYFKIKDNNKLVPNLCLINADFKEQYNYLMNKKNTKLLDNYNKQQHIREINDRMYYNNLKKKFHEEGFTDEIKRKLKLTEYIIIQRAKKQMFIKQFNKNFSFKRKIDISENKQNVNN